MCIQPRAKMPRWRIQLPGCTGVGLTPIRRRIVIRIRIYTARTGLRSIRVLYRTLRLWPARCSIGLIRLRRTIRILRSPILILRSPIRILLCRTAALILRPRRRRTRECWATLLPRRRVPRSRMRVILALRNQDRRGQAEGGHRHGGQNRTARLPCNAFAPFPIHRLGPVVQKTLLHFLQLLRLRIIRIRIVRNRVVRVV